MMAVMSLTHAAILLTVSFFVFLAARKIEAGPLKTFGISVAVLIMVCVLLIAGTSMCPNSKSGWMKKSLRSKCMMMKCK